MKRIGILTAGGDTPALNATIYGAVMRANELRLEAFGFIKGFSSLHNPRTPHVHLNPLFLPIPELDAARGGTIIGSSRDYVDPDNTPELDQILRRLEALKIEGLICIGGDGTLNGLQPISEKLPCVLSPKTIDNDLGLNYENEPNEWIRVPDDSPLGYRYSRSPFRTTFSLENIVNYVTPGYATAVFVSSDSINRIRTTAESHRRVAIVEVMGRDSGYIALGTAYGQPDIILVPEHPLHLDGVVETVKELYDLQKNVVIVCGEGIVDQDGQVLGAMTTSTDPAGNRLLSGAAEALRNMLIQSIGDGYFKSYRRGASAAEAIFTRKVGHTQRGGRPVQFDRFYAAQLGGKAVDLLVEGANNRIATLQYHANTGFTVDSLDANQLRDRWGMIRPRQMHPSLYDSAMMRPSQVGVDYLLPIFTNAVSEADVEYLRQKTLAPGNLTRQYHSVNTDINKRIRYLS